MAALAIHTGFWRPDSRMSPNARFCDICPGPGYKVLRRDKYPGLCEQYVESTYRFRSRSGTDRCELGIHDSFPMLPDCLREKTGRSE